MTATWRCIVRQKRKCQTAAHLSAPMVKVRKRRSEKYPPSVVRTVTHASSVSMHAPHAMYASVVCERPRALSVAAEAQVLPWVCRADDHAGLTRHRARGGAILKRETVSALPLVIPRARVDVPAAGGMRRRRASGDWGGGRRPYDHRAAVSRVQRRQSVQPDVAHHGPARGAGGRAGRDRRLPSHTTRGPRRCGADQRPTTWTFHTAWVVCDTRARAPAGTTRRSPPCWRRPEPAPAEH